MERLQISHSVLDGMTPGKSFCPGMERLKGSLSIPGQMDSRGVILSSDRKTPGESFYHEIEQLQGVIQSWDRTTPGESFCPGIERLQGSHSVLG